MTTHNQKQDRHLKSHCNLAQYFTLSGRKHNVPQASCVPSKSWPYPKGDIPTNERNDEPQPILDTLF